MIPSSFFGCRCIIVITCRWNVYVLWILFNKSRYWLQHGSFGFNMGTIRNKKKYFNLFFKQQHIYLYQVQLASMFVDESSFISKPCLLFTFFKCMFIDLILWTYILEMWTIFYLARSPFQMLKVLVVVHYVYFFDYFK